MNRQRVGWFHVGVVAVLSLGMIPSVVAQTAEFSSVTSITYDRFVKRLAVHGDDVWAGTTGGVLRFDTLTGEFEKFTRVADGLPHNDITAVAAASDGTVWAGTNFGLGRFDPDSRSWTALTSSNSPLTDNLITALAVDTADAVWIGTFAGGLFRFDGTTWTNFTPANSGLSDVFVTSIVFDLDGNAWVGAWGDGVDRFDGETWENFDPGNTGTPPGICFPDLSRPPHELGLISAFVRVLGVDPQRGDLWFRNDDDGFCLLNGVTQLEGDEWRTFTRQNSGLGTNSIEAAGFAPDGSVWLGGFGSTSRLAGGVWTVFPFTTLAMALQAQDLYFGTPFGLGRLTGTGAFEELVKPGLPDGLVYDVALEGQDRWFATRAGLVRLRAGSFTEFTTFNSDIPGNDVRAVEVDRQGNVWVGTSVGGVGKYDGTGWTTFNTANSNLPVNRIEALEIDGEGNVWAGFGLLSGAAWFNGETWSRLTVGGVHDIAAGGDDLVWMATSQGAVRVRGIAIDTFRTDDGLPGNFLTSVAIAPNGDVWFGSFSNGVARFDGRSFETFSTGSGLTDDSIRAIGVGKKGRVWVGTLDHGLNFYDGTAWTEFSFDDGLVFDRVKSITFDSAGRAWIGTEHGVSHLVVAPGVGP
jgi:ligand-binding sensor domain-containing protein